MQNRRINRDYAHPTITVRGILVVAGALGMGLALVYGAQEVGEWISQVKSLVSTGAG